jgi:hypothetical protein
MSTWIEIKDQEDIEFSPESKGNYTDIIIAEATIDILYSIDDFGANYISVPLRLILNTLMFQGYEIHKDR